MLWETHNPLESLPPLPRESRRLIAAFLDANHDVFELAEHLEQDLFDLIQRLSDPAIKAWLAAITTLENSARRECALRTLDAALTNSADKPTLRRCASRLLRHFELTRPRTPVSSTCPQSMQPDRNGAAYTNHTTSQTLNTTTIAADQHDLIQQHKTSVTTPKENPTPTAQDLSESSSESPGTPTQGSPISSIDLQQAPQPTHLFQSSVRMDSERIVTAASLTISHEPRQHSHPAPRLPRAPERVYKAFLDPAALCKWCPPNGFTGTVHSMDVRVGGSYKMSFTNFNTGQAHSFGGTYRELVPHSKIRYTDKFDDPSMPGEMSVTIELKKVLCGTDVTITQENLPAQIPVEFCYMGWQESLLLLAKLVEAEIP